MTCLGNNDTTRGYLNNSEEIVAKKIWDFLWKIRFLNKEKNLVNNEHFEKLFETNDELFLEIWKTWSNNLVEVRNKWPQKEIFKLLQDILSEKTKEELNWLTKSYMRRNLLDNQAKEKEIIKIKEIFVDLEFILWQTKDDAIKERINSFKKHFKNL